MLNQDCALITNNEPFVYSTGRNVSLKEFFVPRTEQVEVADPVPCKTNYLWGKRVGTEGWITLGKPIEIEIRKEEGLFFAENFEFNLTGVEENKEGAISDFVEFLIHDFFVLASSPSEKLSLGAKQLLKEYKEIITEYEIHPAR